MSRSFNPIFQPDSSEVTHFQRGFVIANSTRFFSHLVHLEREAFCASSTGSAAHVTPTRAAKKVSASIANNSIERLIEYWNRYPKYKPTKTLKSDPKHTESRANKTSNPMMTPKTIVAVLYVPLTLPEQSHLALSSVFRPLI